MSAPEHRLDEPDVLAQIARLPPLPAVALQLLQSLDDEGADTERLSRLIATDQILAARLLRVANSSFYGMQGRIHSIRDAVVLIGFRGLRSLALAASVSKALSGDCGRLDLCAFWRHGLAAALAAQELGRRASLNPDQCFAAGLLHDIGQLLLARAFPRQFAQVQAWQMKHDCATQEAERAVLGIDHMRIGQLLAEQWRFPENLVLAIAGHHDSAVIQRSAHAAVAHVANAIVIALDVEPEAAAPVPPIDETAWRRFVASPDELLAILRHVDAQVEAAAGLLPCA
jgi:HD-like signal output (HDOD) protein